MNPLIEAAVTASSSFHASGASTGRTVEAGRKQMFLDFCAALENRGIAYVILSGYQGYPNRIDSDIDFMVSEADFVKLPDFFRHPDAIPGARLVQVLQHETTACYYVLATLLGEHVAYLHPDSAASYRRKGRLWLHADLVLSSRRKSNAGFWIPSAALEFEYYFVKRVDKAHVEARHLRQLAALLVEDPTGCRKALARLAPEELVQPIVNAIAAEDVAWLEHRRRDLQRMIARTNAREPFGDRIRNRAREWARRACRILQPTGLVIAVLGPDGSGKTTVIEHLERELAPAFRRTRRYHLRPHFGAPYDSALVSDPHSQKPRGHLASAAKVGLFLVDYWVGWLRFLQPAKVRSSLVIFDRYYHDMLVDPARYRLPPRNPLPRLFAGLIPRPDLWLVLHAQPEQLVARKGEITLEAAERLSRQYERLAHQLDAHLVDTGCGLDATLAEALQVPLDYLAARTRRRTGPTQ